MGKETHCSVYSVSTASVILCSLALSAFGRAQAHERFSSCSHLHSCKRAIEGSAANLLVGL